MRSAVRSGCSPNSYANAAAQLRTPPNARTVALIAASAAARSNAAIKTPDIVSASARTRNSCSRDIVTTSPHLLLQQTLQLTEVLPAAPDTARENVSASGARTSTER